MAAQDSGTFDLWITGRIPFDAITPKSGSTGDFDRWITDRLHFDTYQEVAAAEEAGIHGERGTLRGVGRGVGRGV